MIILVVEDEVSIAQLIKRGLELDSYEVDLSHDGLEGLNLALRNQYDLILLDRMLPGINGIDITKMLRAKNNSTPIILLTARASTEDRIIGLEAGADGYLAKPFTFDELTSNIRTMLSRQKISIAPGAANNNSANIELCEIDTACTGEEMSIEVPLNTLNLNREQSSNGKLSEINSRILDNAPLSIITINKYGDITSANKYFENFSKTDKSHTHNIFQSAFFERENLLADYRKLLLDGTIVRRENCYEKNSRGEDKYLKIIAVPLKDHNGQIEGALSMAVDNTETVLYKNKLMELNVGLEQKISQRTLELNAANQELAKVLKIKTSFMADVSHEMRTSLTIIQGNLELMNLVSSIKTECAESNEQIYNEIKRMSTMLTDLTTLSNSDETAVNLSREKVDLNKLIATVCKSLNVVAADKNIVIEHMHSEQLVEITADEIKLEKLLSNLVRNAIKYNYEYGRIKVWLDMSGKEARLNVEDGGLGIPKESLPFIFERFYRVDKARSRNYGGSGLGLAICKWIAEIHGGKIEVKSNIGQGSLFTVRLPLDTENN